MIVIVKEFGKFILLIEIKKNWFVDLYGVYMNGMLVFMMIIKFIGNKFKYKVIGVLIILVVGLKWVGKLGSELYN